MTQTYRTAAAFKQALEQRLRAEEPRSARQPAHRPWVTNNRHVWLPNPTHFQAGCNHGETCRIPAG
jgi:hypothetical protein